MESKEKSIGGHRMMLQKQVEDMGMASERHKGIGYMGKGSMEGDIVIILAALLCALICALGLNSMVRCALRCSRRLSSESEEEISARLANKGMKKAALKALPTSVYVAPTKQEGQQQHQAFECPICLGEFEDGQKVRVLPMCNHAFHVACIDTWLLSHSSCPTCRSCLTLLQHHHAIDIAMGRLDREDGTCSSLSTSSSHHHHHHHHILGMLEAALPSLQGHSPSHPH